MPRELRQPLSISVYDSRLNSRWRSSICEHKYVDVPSKRRARVYKQGSGTVVVLPVDWCRGMEIEPGDVVELLYNGRLTISKPGGNADE